MCIVRFRLRGAFTELTLARSAACAVLLALTPSLAAAAPSPAPGNRPSPAAKSNTKLVYIFPKTTLHTEFLVEVNKLGQVTHVRAGKPSKDVMFNTQTYTSALMSYIRTPDGMHATVGTYKLKYDYNPKSHMVHRGVELVSRGGVDANAPGAVTAMKKRGDEQMRQANAQQQQPAPNLPPLRAFGIPSSAPSPH